MDNVTLTEQKRLWEGLKLHPAWQDLMLMAQAQIEGRKVTVLEPMQQGQEYYREFLKGEVAGIQTFILLVDTAIETLEIEIERLNKEQGNAA